MERDQLLKRTQVATVLNVSTRTVRRYEQRGMLPVIKMTRSTIRYRVIDVMKLLETLRYSKRA